MIEHIIKFIEEHFFEIIILTITPLLSYFLSRKKQHREMEKLIAETERIEAEKEALDRENYRKSIEFEKERTARLELEIRKIYIELNDRIIFLEDCEKERELLRRKIDSITELVDVCEQLIEIVKQYDPVKAEQALVKLLECKRTLG